MRPEVLPGKLFEKFFPETDLLRARKGHRFVPGNFAIADSGTAGVRGWAVRLSFAIALPDAVRAIRVAGGPVHQAQPKHATRPFSRNDFFGRGEHFIAGF